MNQLLIFEILKHVKFHFDSASHLLRNNYFIFWDTRNNYFMLSNAMSTILYNKFKTNSIWQVVISGCKSNVSSGPTL